MKTKTKAEANARAKAKSGANARANANGAVKVKAGAKAIAVLLCVLFVTAFFGGCTDSRKSDAAYRRYVEDINQLVAAAPFLKDVEAEAFQGANPNEIVIMKPGSEITEELRLTGFFTYYSRTRDNTYLQNCAKAFVEEYPHVKIVIDNYGDPYDYGDKFPVLLMSESYGDIVMFPWNMKASYLQDTKFVDLMRYINDETKFNPDEYYMNIILAERNPDGKLLCLPTYFDVEDMGVFLGSLSESFAERFETDPNLSLKDLLRFYKEKKAEMGADWKMRITFFFSPVKLITKNFDELVDFKTKQAKFTDPEFMEWMEFVKNEVYVDLFQYTEDGLTSSTVWFGEDISIQAISDKDSTTMIREVYMDDLILMPTFNRVLTEPRVISSFSGKNHFSGDVRYGISRRSKNPDLAWKFIEFLVKERHIDPLDPKNPSGVLIRVADYHKFFGIGYPINRANFRTCLDVDFEVTTGKHRRNYEQSLTCSWDEYIRSSKDFYLNAVEKLNYSDFWSGDFFEYGKKGIIWDEMYLYLSDLQSVEETMRNIENKVEIMLNE